MQKNRFAANCESSFQTVKRKWKKFDPPSKPLSKKQKKSHELRKRVQARSEEGLCKVIQSTQ
jgi:hypothetical protein